MVYKGILLVGRWRKDKGMVSLSLGAVPALDGSRPAGRESSFGKFGFGMATATPLRSGIPIVLLAIRSSSGRNRIATVPGKRNA